MLLASFGYTYHHVHIVVLCLDTTLLTVLVLSNPLVANMIDFAVSHYRQACRMTQKANDCFWASSFLLTSPQCAICCEDKTGKGCHNEQYDQHDWSALVIVSHICPTQDLYRTPLVHEEGI